MGGGNWSDSSFRDYSRKRGRSVDSSGSISGSYKNQEIFKAHRLDKMLDPKGVIRECCDSEEHPNVVPVILALDVTGSMGQAAVEVAKKINIVMTELYKTVADVQFMIMGIGDMASDECPCQASQFESDIRIADQLEKIYFEFGGGGNSFESYTLPWYFALHHTKIDAIDKRGKKGIIITMGDESLNPYIPKTGRDASIESVFGDKVQDSIDTKDLYEEVKDRFNIYHIHVSHNSSLTYDFNICGPTFANVIGKDHIINSTLDDIADKIIEIVSANANQDVEFVSTSPVSSGLQRDENGAITW